jgi:hypothetical protein
MKSSDVLNNFIQKKRVKGQYAVSIKTSNDKSNHLLSLNITCFLEKHIGGN